MPMGIIKGAIKNSTSLIWLAIPRIFIGIVFLKAGIEKYKSNWFNEPKLQAIIEKWIVGNPWEFWVKIMNEQFLPHATELTYVVVFGEILAGLSLLLGASVKLGALGTLLMSVVFYLSAGHTSTSAAGFNLLIAINSLAFFFSNAGRSLGLDGRK